MWYKCNNCEREVYVISAPFIGTHGNPYGGRLKPTCPFCKGNGLEGL